jgi:hypothetical protein
VHRQLPGQIDITTHAWVPFLRKALAVAAFRYNFVGPGRWVTVG